MDPSPFTIEEKRFILAELIKASSISVEVLVAFIREQNVLPNWMHMQIPHGRNMSQCMQIVDHLSIRPMPWDRQRTVHQGGAASSLDERPRSSPERDYTAMPPIARISSPLNRHLLPIAPRPPLGGTNDQPQRRPDSCASDNQKPTRKRGRPSKADMAKRDLRPNLPKPIAPRPTLPTRDFQPLLPAFVTPPAVMQPAEAEEISEKKRRRLTAPAS
ncbi:hypothetical protein HIM_07782 [Hirsutella minnesotensis 3608]|uniref:Uncharacterized protein n=1 Tax=Hirsutella minnesotensis 3608 TaxID=1043627 RepID=A0A0F7ZTB8_9HYPO|nr:hypothetical protein HIM_07782 [Hirsutella minnesotensis 3608]